jgi:SWI/SNF-related matrix-associated actin-dependent regulator 1 of chromatin subfamily A
LKTKPFPYQIEGARLIHEIGGRALLADEVGLGKSLQSLIYACDHNPVRPLIIVCPATIKWNWQRECLKHYSLRAQVLSGMRPYPEGTEVEDIVIINYDILAKSKHGDGWLGFLKELGPKIIVLDEVHNIADPFTKRTKAVKDLCKGVPHVIGLSGTPFTNRPMELYNFLSIIKPKLFPSRHAFGYEFCGARRAPWGWTYNGATKKAKLHKLLIENVMIRRTKEEVLSELPEKQRTVVPLEIKNKKEYREALDDFVGWVRKKSPEKAIGAQKAEALVKVGYLKRLASELKMNGVFSWLDDFLECTDSKVIVFAVHKKIVSGLVSRYKTQSVKVDGSVTGKSRQAAIDKFLGQEKTRMLIGNIRAAGAGWSAKGVSNVVFVEMEWAPGLMQQCEGRCVGIGRGVEGTSTQVHYLVAKETFEEDLAELLQKKQKILDSVIDGKKSGDFDIFDKLVMAILRKHK